jgi:glycosyltransferase involved in cell wall biosynthesis
MRIEDAGASLGEDRGPLTGAGTSRCDDNPGVALAAPATPRANLLMTVGFDITPSLVSPAGVGRYPRELLAALRRSPEVSVEVLAAARRAPRGRLSRVAQGLVREGLYYPFGLSRRARRSNVDLVHCPGPFTPRVRDRPLVMTVHDVLPLRHPELFTRTIVAHMRLVTSAFLRRADRILTGSRHTRNELVELLGLAGDRIDVTPYGVDERFRPVERDSDWLERRLGLRGRYVLCVGTLEPRKNLRAALRAFRLVADEVADCALVVAGGRGWRNELFERELDRASERVVLTGYLEDEELVRLYSGADCFLFPSLSEGFGFPVLEAMACGAPVVSSDRTSLPEVVGDAGVLVDPEDVEGQAAAVMRLLSEPELAGDLRRRGLERSSRFSWDACAASTLESYRRALV